MQAGTEPEATLFEAAIVPHRSLSPRGLRILISVICLLSLLTVLRFWVIGAWPVAGFSAAEVALAIFLLRLNAQRARASELLLLSESRLRIICTDMRGVRQERSMRADWLTMALEERAGRVPALLLRRQGVEVEIAASLGEAEKRDLAQALEAALHNLRNPQFDNPQLRV